MEVVYEKPGHITVSYEPRRRYMLFDWTSFYVTLDEIGTLHRQALDHARSRRCIDYVADTSKVTNALPQAVVQWWGDTWVPVLTDYGLRSIVTIVPSAALAKSSTNRWQKHVANEIALANVGSRAEAEALLAKLGAKSA